MSDKNHWSNGFAVGVLLSIVAYSILGFEAAEGLFLVAISGFLGVFIALSVIYARGESDE